MLGVLTKVSISNLTKTIQIVWKIIFLIKFTRPMEQHKSKQKIIQMLNSYSPKQLKSYLSNVNNQTYVNDISYNKNRQKNTNPFQKKSISPNNLQTTLSQSPKYIISKGGKSSQKLLMKCDSQKKYLVNYTTSGTPFEKSTMLSYVSTPNQKSFAGTCINSTMQKLQKKMKKIKSLKKFLTKDRQQFPSTQQETFSEKCVKVKFIISNSLGSIGQSKQKQKKDQKGYNNNQSSSGDTIIYKTFPCFTSFQTMRSQFINDSHCLSDRMKNQNYGFLGFETIPYDYQLCEIVNSTKEQAKFDDLISRQVREITLTPIILKKRISYENLEFKDFQVLNYLGSGGFSSVYLAKCLVDGQMCALKFIKKDTITSAKKVRMLENERSILFTVTHPNLIDLYYAFETKSYIVFGLEYCPHGNLFNFLQKTKGVTQRQAKIIFKQILNGLEYLHDNNILFRDVKLQNILFDGQGNIKITDFGLSKPEISDQDVTYSYCGSPQYMAPQMLSKEGHSFGVDYYALGILLYELFYGKSPFYANKKQDIFVAILSSDPVFPKEPAISREAKTLIKGLLAKNPKHRIGSLKGIKEIRGHPWLRNFEYSPQKSKGMRFNNMKSLQSQQHFQMRKALSKQKEIKASSDENMMNILAGSLKHNVQSDPRRIKQTFDEQKRHKNTDRYFFEQSFVNRNLLQKVQKQIYKFSSNAPQEKQRMFSRNKKKAYVNNFTATLPSSHTSHRENENLRKLESKNSTRNKHKPKYL